jgi:hypothetical protein
MCPSTLLNLILPRRHSPGPKVGAQLRNKRMFVRMPRANLGSGMQLLDRLQQYQSLLLFLERGEGAPKTLFQQTILTLRKKLRRPISKSVPLLPLPNKLKKELYMMDDLTLQMEVEPMISPRTEARPANALQMAAIEVVDV